MSSGVLQQIVFSFFNYFYTTSGLNKQVSVEQLKVYNLGMHNHMCSYYLTKKKEALHRHKRRGANKVGCAIEENQHEIAVVCVYKVQTKVVII